MPSSNTASTPSGQHLSVTVVSAHLREHQDPGVNTRSATGRSRTRPSDITGATPVVVPTLAGGGHGAVARCSRRRRVAASFVLHLVVSECPLVLAGDQPVRDPLYVDGRGAYLLRVILEDPDPRTEARRTLVRLVPDAEPLARHHRGAISAHSSSRA